MELKFVTGNANKFKVAKAICIQHDISLEQIVIDLDEIQSEDPEQIINAKVKAAYEAIGEPVVVSDDSWHMPALNGFPGPYMKSINHWFTTQDFLNLMADKSDRTAIIIKLLAHYDGSTITIFRKDTAGKLLKESRGNSNIPIRNIFVGDANPDTTLAEFDALGQIDSPNRLNKEPEPWHDLAPWFKS